MEIKVGKKYKRVKMSGKCDNETFIGQPVTVVRISNGIVRYKKVYRSGKVDDFCAQTVKEFLNNFKPLNLSLENK
ncbi:MAG: hypothetical protein [Caudoviricetes sp.]|nr:MAG: hypothetical protein [Caudoviricetes sp.]